MSDKERILLWLVNTMYRTCLFRPETIKAWNELQYSSNGNPDLKPGDFVTTFSSMKPNEFIVGFFVNYIPHGAVIREIGSKRLCNYTNDNTA